MADRKITVLNPSGYQELFQSGDNLVLSGTIDMSSNLITDLPNCVNDNDVARKKYVDDSISAVIGGSPSTLDTLNELAAALADDSNYAATITTALGLKSPIASPTFTGIVTGPTINASTALQIGGVAVTSTAAELNILDGVTATTAELNYSDGVTSNIQTQIDTKAPLASPTFTGTVTGPTINASTALQIGGVAVTSTATELNILDGVTSTAAELNILDGVTATAAELNVLDGLNRGHIIVGNASGAPASLAEGSENQVLTIDSSGDAVWTSPAEGGGEFTGVTAGTVSASKGVIVDSNKDITGFRNVSLTGELDTATLDVSGDADIDGTTNLDAVDIDGATQIDATVTVGVDDTGYDVKFFGATASAYCLWDESADDLILAGDAGLVVPDGQFTLASTAVTSTAAELNILDGVTSTAAELNILDGVTSTAAELNILDGVTATTAELNYCDGVTSNIQTQINTKAPIASPTFTGTVTVAAMAGEIDCGVYAS